ncbi:hypothetical protein DFJ73DRAFT_247753 [Zopfochytrium polystomum]|nr:hypothetical protein DFJ73DRAFT_247753 [Zopfochytrium polystomum]
MQYLQFFACERPRTVSPGPDAVKVETVDKGIPKLEPVNPQGAGAPLVSDGEPEYAAASAEVSTNAPEVTIGKTLAGPIITNGNHESPCEPLSNPVQVPTGTAKTDKTCRTTSKKKKAKTPKASNENRKAIPKKAAGECAPPANDVPAMPTEKAASPICSCDTNINLPPEITRSNEVVPDFDSQKVSVDPSQFDLLDTVETISAQNNLNVTMEDSSHVSNAGNPNGVTVGAVEASGIKNGLTYEDNDNFTILSNCLEYIRKVRCANSAISIREAAEAFLAEAGLQDKGCFIAMNLEPVPPMSWEDAIECAQKFVDIVKEPLEVATFHSNSSKLVEQPTDLLGTLLSRLRGDEEAEQEFVRKGKKSKKRTKARNRRKKSQLDDSASAPELHGASAHPICEICLQEQDRTASPAPSPELQVPAESMQVSAEDAKDRDEPIDIIQLLDQGSLYILQLLDSVRWMVSEGESLIKMPTSEKWSAATEAEAKKLVKDAITVQLESAGSAGSDELEALERKLEDARSRQAYFEAQLKSVVRRNKEWLPTVGHSLMVDSKVIETATRVAL